MNSLGGFSPCGEKLFYLNKVVDIVFGYRALAGYHKSADAGCYTETLGDILATEILREEGGAEAVSRAYGGHCL